MAYRNYAWFPVGLSSIQNSVINSTDVYMGAIFQAHAGKTISKIGWYSSIATGSPVVDVRLETVSNGLPTNTLVATGAELTGQSIASSTWYSHTLSTPYVVPTGAVTLVAGTIRYVSGTSVTANIRSGFSPLQTGLPRPFYYSSGSPISSIQTIPIMCLEYSDGTVSASMPVTAVTNTAFTSASNPDEIGNVFVAPYNTYCVGIMGCHRHNSTSGTIRYRIYDSDLNVLTVDSELSFTAGANIRGATSSAEPRIFPIQTPIALVAGKTYYITVTATSTDTNVIYTNTLSFNSTTQRNSWYNFAYYCSRQNDTGAFSTDTTKVEMIAPVIDNSFSNRIYIA